jgi:hypothetical protein
MELVPSKTHKQSSTDAKLIEVSPGKGSGTSSATPMRLEWKEPIVVMETKRDVAKKLKFEGEKEMDKY